MYKRYTRFLIPVCLMLILKLKGHEQLPENGLTACYLFNDRTTNDLLGKNNARAYNIIPTEDRFGNAGYACGLRGNIDSYLNLGSSPELKPAIGSISLWVKVDMAVYKGKGVEYNPILMTRSHPGNNFNEAFLMAYAYSLRKLVAATAFSDTIQSNLNTRDISYFGQWYHLVMTYDEKRLMLYVNGQLNGQTKRGFRTRFLQNDSVLVGMCTSIRNERYFLGSVDDIRFYNRVLLPAEVLALYKDPNPNHLQPFIRWGLCALAVLVFIVSIIYFVKWRIAVALRAEKEKNKLNNNWYEQENRVITAQMNPHFIFNSLNTIQQFIVISDNEKAQSYLSKFSKLLRMILENNAKDNISLKDEIDVMESYLEIESLRFSNVFTYRFQVTAGMEPEKILIPRFLIQPFVENAIWHGLLPKDGEKELCISFEIKNERSLICVVEDNGIGMKKETNPSKKNKSFAIVFIKQRLELMSKLYKETYGVEIIEKNNPAEKISGIKIVVTIPILK